LQENKLHIKTGVDIVDISRAKKLYRNHKNRLSRYLSAYELVWLNASPKKVEALAEIMAIKEAVFKSLEIDWFGLEGWKKIELKKKNGKVDVTISDGFLNKSVRKMNFWIATARTKEFVVAHVISEKCL
jgi:holo-[acyl-carrier-protein] synthase